MFVILQDYTPASKGVDPYIIPLPKPSKGRFVGIKIIKSATVKALAFEIYGFPLGIFASRKSLTLSRYNGLIFDHAYVKDNSTQVVHKRLA